METAVVNGSSAIARAVIRRMARQGLTQLTFCDQHPFRDGVYDLQKSLDGVTLDKHQTLNASALAFALEGKKNAVYITHDYFSMTHDKNDQLIATARVAKEAGVEKLIAVCPIEHDLYYTEGEQDPIHLRAEAEEQAHAQFPTMILLRPNLTYGGYSYFIRYLMQSVIAGKIPAELADPND